MMDFVGEGVFNRCVLIVFEVVDVYVFVVEIFVRGNVEVVNDFVYMNVIFDVIVFIVLFVEFFSVVFVFVLFDIFVFIESLSLSGICFFDFVVCLVVVGFLCVDRGSSVIVGIVVVGIEVGSFFVVSMES